MNEARSSLVLKDIIVTCYMLHSAWELIQSSPKVKSNMRARGRWKDLECSLNWQSMTQYFHAEVG